MGQYTTADKSATLNQGFTLRSKTQGAARKYAERGFPVFPCKHWPEKSPLTGPGGFHKATTDPSRVTAFWNSNPGASIGIPTGEKFWVLDIDDLEAIGGLDGELPETWTVKTPSGGLHLYFQNAEGITNSPGSLPEGLDVRGVGTGYVLVPPSPGYTVVDRSPVAEAPEWLLEIIQEEPPRRPPRSRSRERVKGGEKIPEGQRNSSLFFEALDLKDSGRDAGEVLDGLRDINDARCATPLDDCEVEKVAKSAIRYPIRSGSPTPELVEAIESLEATWWERPWPGVGGKTDRDVLRVLIELARRYGRLKEDGSIEISASVRSVALAAATRYATVSGGATKRLAEAGLIRKTDNGRGLLEAATWVLLPQASLPRNTKHQVEREVLCVTDPLRSRLWDLETPSFRWTGHVKKGRAGVLYALEAHGSMSLEKLAEVMGWGNHRELKRRYVLPLISLGLIEDRGGEYALPGDYAEKVEEARKAPHTTIRRRKRTSIDLDGHEVHWVEETESTASETERDQRDQEQHEKQREAFKLYLLRQSSEADQGCVELLNRMDDERGLAGLISELEKIEPEPQSGFFDSARRRLGEEVA